MERRMLIVVTGLIRLRGPWKALRCKAIKKLASPRDVFNLILDHSIHPFVCSQGDRMIFEKKIARKVNKSMF
jgi:hypothetical protein